MLHLLTGVHLCLPLIWVPLREHPACLAGHSLGSARPQCGCCLRQHPVLRGAAVQTRLESS